MREVKEVTTSAGERRYRVRYRFGGRQTSETFRNQRDAQTFAAILDGGGVGQALAWLDARDQSVSEYSFREWHDHYCDQLTGITERTRDDYRSLRRRYLADLDLLPINLVTRTHVTTLVNGMERSGLSPKTIKNVVNMLSSCMALAVDEGHLATNPCRRVRLPKQASVEHEERYLTYEEFGRLEAAIDPHYRGFITFLVGTGLRWSEATALEGRHVDLVNGTIRVQQAWKRGPEGPHIGPPKSRKSNRTVNAASLALLAAAQAMTGPRSYVFTTPAGRRIHYSNFRERVWVPACEAAELDPRPTPHDLRHTFASWLLSDGRSIEAVQDQLGHESLETTRKVYAKLMPAVGAAAGKSASAALERALSQPRHVLALDAFGDPHQAAESAGEQPDVRGGRDR